MDRLSNRLRASLAASLILAALPGLARADDSVRRIVTGLDASGRSVALFDSELPLKAQAPGRPKSVNLWATFQSPANLSSTDAVLMMPPRLPPPDDGTKFQIAEFPPTTAAQDAKLPIDTMMKVVGNLVPKKGRPPRDPAMHRTRTVDYAIVLSGEMDMLLDDSTIHVKAGDVIIQQATNHAWVNHGTQPCRIMFVLMDSKEP